MRLLLAEDEADLSRALVTVLKHNNYSVDAVYDGAEALDYLENGGNYDGVILDIMMAGMDGFEVLKQIRQRMGEIPVILLSARQEEYDKVLGLGLGADDYVTKPFSPGEMMARVKVQLRKGMKIEKKAERILEADGLRMDTESCQVTVDGREVVLAGKEFWLLKFFMEHPGQVFTKAQIYHHVWEDGYEDDNTVMVYISKLREKLEDKPNERIWIQTIRGIGYRFGGSR